MDRHIPRHSTPFLDILTSTFSLWDSYSEIAIQFKFFDILSRISRLSQDSLRFFHFFRHSLIFCWESWDSYDSLRFQFNSNSSRHTTIFDSILWDSFEILTRFLWSSRNFYEILWDSLVFEILLGSFLQMVRLFCILDRFCEMLWDFQNMRRDCLEMLCSIFHYQRPDCDSLIRRQDRL